jgi:hypothetical protein
MAQPGLEINYLAKDYAGFRRLMLDRLAVLLPDGVEDQPADLQVALVELLAYVADHLSYYQDAVATEAYLATARSRVSLRRHSRLLCYRIHEGCNARVWVRCEVKDNVTNVKVKENWRFLTWGTPPVVFEPCHFPDLYPQHNEIAFYGGGVDTTLAAGATKAELVQTSPNLSLKVGDILIFEALGQNSAASLKHAVRLTEVEQGGAPGFVQIRWHADDALPFRLPVLLNGEPLAMAYGNIVLADHGEWHRGDNLNDTPAEGTPYRPYLTKGPLTCTESYPLDFTTEGNSIVTSAAGLMHTDPSKALPIINLGGDGDVWLPCSDLLESGCTDPAFVVETDNNGNTRLRFGDGTYGRLPAYGVSFTADYRIGNGLAGNVGVDMLNIIEGAGTGGIKISNPLPAQGGKDPELSEEVRLFAPQAFRRQLRAINADDYAARAQEFPGVRRASAEILWTGSWYTVYLYVDRSVVTGIDDAFKHNLLRYLDGFRLAGYEIEVRQPTSVVLDIELAVDVKPGFVIGEVIAALKDSLNSAFFDAGNWTMGQPVYLSRLYRAALVVPGVGAVKATIFKRDDENSNLSRDRGEIAIGVHEIIGHHKVKKDEPDPTVPGRWSLTIGIANDA